MPAPASGVPDLPLVPPDLTLFEAIFLVAASFVTSGISATFGLGGGVSFLAVLASVVPAAAIIPIHGVVQLGANVSRAILRFSYTNWYIAVYFMAGSIVGAAIGGHLVVQLPEEILKGVLGVFILYATWGPMRFRLEHIGRVVLVITGIVSTFLTMFIGATGPFVISVIGPAMKNKHQYIATHAVCMVLQHGMKVVVFGLLGFAYHDWLVLILATVAASFAGTALGLRLLSRVPEETFRKILRIVLSLLALNLLAGAIGIFN